MGGIRGEVSDDILRAFFAQRSNENCSALWTFLSKVRAWRIEPGENLARSWDGFVLAYWQFDVDRPNAGSLARAFLHLVHLNCLSVRRDERSRFAGPVSVPRGSSIRCVRLDPETWDVLMAELPEEDPDAQDAASPRVDVRRARFVPYPLNDTDPGEKARTAHRRP